MYMYFVIDIGSSNVVFGVYRQDVLLHQWRVGTHIRKTRDEYLSLIQKFLISDNINPLLFKKTVISSVVPPLTLMFQCLVQELTGQESYLIDHTSFPHMAIQTDFPSLVGTDRLVNALAGYQIFKSSLIIVDCGTATNFDVVSEDGSFLGGVISPGLLLSLDALIQKTSKLPGIKIEQPERVIGRNTTESLQSGIIFGYAGMVDSMIQRINTELGYSPKVIATGGLAKIVKAASNQIEDVIDDLTLRGLYFISQNLDNK